MRLDLFGKSAHEDYQAINKLYETYVKVGGYPAIVANYLEHENFHFTNSMVKEFNSSFIQESAKYMPKVEVPRFDDISENVPSFIMRGKWGKTIDFRDYMDKNGNFDWISVEAVVNWLMLCRVIGFCTRAVDCDFSRKVHKSRIFYKDIGMAAFNFSKAGELDVGNIRGAIAENFAFIELDRLDPDIGITHRAPYFGTYQNGEIDFLVFSHETACTFGIDVKYGKGHSKTGIKLLRDGIIDYLIYARANSTGGEEEPGILSIPIYLLGGFDFDAIHPNQSTKTTKTRQNQIDYLNMVNSGYLEREESILLSKHKLLSLGGLGTALLELFRVKFSRYTE
jgi:predicted AAA+ superfamily ATPase